MKYFLLPVIFLFGSLVGFAQNQSGLWQKLPSEFRFENKIPTLQPKKFSSFQADENVLADFLRSCPSNPLQARVISLPTPEGSFRNFRIWETPMMERPLALKYPEIRTYTAEALDNRQVSAKIDYTPFGFHAYVFGTNGIYLIDPYAAHASGNYIAYYRRDYQRKDSQPMVCATDEQMLGGDKQGNPNPLQNLIYGTTRKTYRLALAADSEYCAAVAPGAPTKPLVLAKMVTTLNRVNGIYERELAVSMVLVANTDALIFLTTSPYSNSSGSAMLGQNQTAVDNIIGSANYDIGHVFSTGGGGIAQRASVCQSNQKARGVTGSASPIGDAFDIDYVAHEMGHQFGANHTFNANTGSCNGNGVASRAYEPGSGTTIMAYAGICGGGNDYQAHSDPYFHSASLEEISSYITLPNGGGTCASSSASTNTNATMPAFAASYSIPYQTPFELTAPVATDATADTLTYCWEERDLGDFKSSLINTHFAGPLFRSYLPTTSTTRIFPALKWLLSGANPIIRGEKLPDTARSMSFRVTERDIYQGWGTFNFPTDAISLNVVNTGAPFQVTAPTQGQVLQGGAQTFITWNVSNTVAAPISAQNVDIYFSTDGGNTFPTLLRSNTPNDGSESVVIPNIPTYSARIKVKGSGNVFFNVNDGDFAIEFSNVGVKSVS
ncbi:MAG: reprolysin-like metallopeptidase, partial [Chitinophagaceae bacterium]